MPRVLDWWEWNKPDDYKYSGPLVGTTIYPITWTRAEYTALILEQLQKRNKFIKALDKKDNVLLQEVYDSIPVEEDLIRLKKNVTIGASAILAEYDLKWGNVK